jgi:hypothetical protein
MDVGDAVQRLGIGLSRLLRYSYGGFLLIVLAAVLNPADTQIVLAAMGWELAALSAIVVGAGIYATHRSVVVPVHHFLLTLLLSRSTDSPTAWLGSIGVDKGWRIMAYTTIRRSAIFDARQVEEWNVAHAESGLVLITAEGFLLAALYACCYPLKSPLPAGFLLVLGVLFLAFSFIPGAGQHRLECRHFRRKQGEIIDLLAGLGMIEPIPPSNKPLQPASGNQQSD